MIFKGLLVFSLFVYCVPGFGTIPEYEFFSEDERNELNGPHLIDGEYQSDKLTYLYSPDFQYQWQTQAQAFQYSAGSLGPTRFLTRGRLKTSVPLTENLELKVFWIERGDYESSRQNIIFDFTYRLSDDLGVSFYGQPRTQKKQDSAGLAINLGGTPENQLKFFHTWVYFSHNKRNEADDKFLKTPKSYGLVWRTNNKERGNYKEWYLRQDTGLDQLFPGDGRRYQFKDLVVSLQGLERLSKASEFLEYHLLARQSFESGVQRNSSASEASDKESAELLLRYIHPTNLVDWIGLKYVYSFWSSESGSVLHNDLIPHFWMSLRNSDQSEGSVDFRLGYEMTWHRAQGDRVLRSLLDRDRSFEHRANLRVDFWFQNQARLYALLTVDVDKFGSGETWEGGSLQFSAPF